MLKSLCEVMGNRILDFCAASGRLTLLLLATLRHLKDANAKEVVRQMALLGADSLPIVMMTFSVPVWYFPYRRPRSSCVWVRPLP